MKFGLRSMIIDACARHPECVPQEGYVVVGMRNASLVPAHGTCLRHPGVTLGVRNVVPAEVLGINRWNELSGCGPSSQSTVAMKILGMSPRNESLG